MASSRASPAATHSETEARVARPEAEERTSPALAFHFEAHALVLELPLEQPLAQWDVEPTSTRLALRLCDAQEGHVPVTPAGHVVCALLKPQRAQKGHVMVTPQGAQKGHVLVIPDGHTAGA